MIITGSLDAVTEGMKVRITDAVAEGIKKQTSEAPSKNREQTMKGP
jgi:hypothetical protein